MKDIFDNKNLIFPDYNNSILNVSALIAKSYGINTSVDPISDINVDKIARKKNIVFIILDGFGYNLLKYYNLPFFKEHFVKKITSVFPPTTASAMTSIYTGKLPAEHGVMGWSLYFKEYLRMFHYLPVEDASTSKAVSDKIYDYFKILKPDTIFRKIAKQNNDLNLAYFTPKYIKGTPYNNLISQGAKTKGYKKESGMLKKIVKTISNKQRNFVFAYSTNPDSIEHHNGTNSQKTGDFLARIDNDLSKFYSTIPNDTAVFITADHGLTDIDEFYIVNNDKDLFNCLYLPTFPESRFVSFFVKPHKIDFFKYTFKKYEDDFALFSRDEFITLGFLGDADYHYKLDDFIGNFIAIATGRKGFRYLYRQKEDKKIVFKAHHSGLTKDEMEVPLFYFEK